MWNKLKGKLKKQGGFTLVEMLIVVAIIAILIMISVPTFTAALEKSREAVDTANERDAANLALVAYMTEDEDFVDADGNVSAYYQVAKDNAHTGSLTTTKPTVSYGQGKDGVGELDEDHTSHVVQVTVSEGSDGTPKVETKWVPVGSDAAETP